jgi:hypothetical protein
MPARFLNAMLGEETLHAVLADLVPVDKLPLGSASLKVRDQLTFVVAQPIGE